MNFFDLHRNSLLKSHYIQTLTFLHFIKQKLKNTDTLRISVFNYISVLPAIALDNVTSSAYSKSPPTDNPCARRVTLMPIGLTRREIYIAVDSPSRFGFIASINSLTSSFFKRSTNAGIFMSSGPIPVSYTHL